MIADRERQILIVSSSEKSEDFFKRNLRKSLSLEFSSGGTDARRKLSYKDYDAVIINAPLKDEYGTELAESIIKDSYAGVLMLVKADVFDDVSYAMEKIGVYCLSKPVSAQTFTQGLTVSLATGERLKGLIKKTESLKEKMEEIKLVGRAKLLLITKLTFTEEQAHRYIEKQAMDRCVKKSVVALDVIKTYSE